MTAAVASIRPRQVNQAALDTALAGADQVYRTAYLAALLGKHRPRWTSRGRRCRCGRPLARLDGTRAPFCTTFVSALVDLAAAATRKEAPMGGEDINPGGTDAELPFVLGTAIVETAGWVTDTATVTVVTIDPHPDRQGGTVQIDLGTGRITLTTDQAERLARLLDNAALISRGTGGGCLDTETVLLCCCEESDGLRT